MSKQTLIWIAALAFSAGALAQELKSLPGNEALIISEKEMSYLVGLCEGCHGPGGRSQREDVPSLAGRPADELFEEIEKFYFYERWCPDVPVDEGDNSKGHMSMCDVVNQMNKPEAEALARHFEAVDPAASP